MVLTAQRSDVTVLVRPTMSQRDDVVRHGRLADNPGVGTISAKGFSAETT